MKTFWRRRKGGGKKWGVIRDFVQLSKRIVSGQEFDTFHAYRLTRFMLHDVCHFTAQQQQQKQEGKQQRKEITKANNDNRSVSSVSLSQSRISRSITTLKITQQC